MNLKLEKRTFNKKSGQLERTTISRSKLCLIFIMLIINNQKQKQVFMTNQNRPSSYNKLSYIQKVSRINRKLRLGDITKAAESTGFSTTHVSDVASGLYFNDTIVNALYDMTRGRKSNVYKLSSLEA